jgi:hypothetical protein
VGKITNDKHEPTRREKETLKRINCAKKAIVDPTPKAPRQSIGRSIKPKAKRVRRSTIGAGITSAKGEDQNQQTDPICTNSLEANAMQNLQIHSINPTKATDSRFT